MTEGIVWNAVALLMVIIFYLCSSNTQFYSERALKLWWRYVRWLLLSAVFALARDTLFSFLTIKDLHVIKLPDLQKAKSHQSQNRKPKGKEEIHQKK